MNHYEKPLPQPTVETKEFWDGCKRHELMIQKCKDCGTYRFYPGGMCHKCTSTKAEWVQVSGRGKIYSWIVVTRAADPVWAKDVPYIVVIVELNEQPGLLMPGNLLGCAPKDVKPGMPVEVFFDDVTAEMTLPKWQPI